jgi:16S rRNA (adenine1518-N6/adenine1519-N6)-dimethyltransferase
MKKIMDGGKMDDHRQNKSLGQHWLSNQPTLKKIVDYAELTNKDYVLEIGPGLGSLTSIISNQAGSVLAVELDKALFNRLKNNNLQNNLEFLNQDILKFDLTKLPKNYKIVANIPYYLTSHLIRLLTESNNPPIKIVLLIQKEVAERIDAKPGSMSVLSVVVQQYFEVSKKDLVSAEMFSPPPKVDSQIIVLSRRKKPIIKTDNDKEFFRLVRIGFSSKRKTLENSISNGLRLDKQQVNTLIIQAKLDPGVRPQVLTIEQWGQLFKVFKAENLV